MKLLVILFMLGVAVASLFPMALMNMLLFGWIHGVAPVVPAISFWSAFQLQLIVAGYSLTTAIGKSTIKGIKS